LTILVYWNFHRSSRRRPRHTTEVLRRTATC
jgi:hypothetical protein